MVYSIVSLPVSLFYIIYGIGALTIMVGKTVPPPFRFAFAFIRKIGLRRAKIIENRDLQQSRFNIPLRRLSGSLKIPARNVSEAGLGLGRKKTGEWILADYVHHSDMVNLLLVSRSIKHNIQSSTGFSLANMRKQTCIPGSKVSCWGCGGQTCNVCDYTV